MALQQDLFASLPPTSPAAPPAAASAPEAGPKTLTLIDATGFVFRAYHALPSLTTSKGVVTHAVLGFTRMILKLLRERGPTHVALCFDKDSRKGRLAIDPEYKANREPPPQDLLSQFEWIRKVAHALALPTLEFPGWEADDVIATLTKLAMAQGFQVEIVASDKDFLQLLAPGVRIFDPVKDRELDEAYALERYGVPPRRMRDYQALVGDAIDNVPKVPGIGPKTAVELLTEFDSVAGLLARLDAVKKPKIRGALTEHRAQLERALQLVSFKDDLPLAQDFGALLRQPVRQAEARALFTELEFYRLLSELPAAPATPLRHSAEVVTTPEALAGLARTLAGVSTLAVAPNFTGEPHSADVRGLLLLAADGCWYVDVATLTAAEVGAALGPALAAPTLTLSAHDGKALLHVLHALGIDRRRVDTDVELLSYLLNPSRKEHALPDLARERFRVELPAVPLGGAPAQEIGNALGGHADAISRLGPELWTELDGVGLGQVARTLEFPLIPVLADMERAGVRVDREVLAGISRQVDQACEELLQVCYRHAGREFNVGSPLQLAQVLFDELKLPVLKKNKTGPSTDHEVLEKLAEQHPLPQAIIDYRNVAKLKSTYLDTLPEQLGPDGRVRTTFHQAAAATGRLSSTNPNLQNIPIRTELGQQIRRAFVAEPGWLLVCADYSQIELRILAHMAGDQALIDAFAAGADVHARTAAEVFGVAEAAVTPEQRRAAKMVNYGIAYGLSPHGLSTRLNVPLEEARGIIERYFARFPGIQGYIDGTLEKAKRQGYVETLFGRRRYMPELASRNRNIAMAGERAAINMPIQGTAADLMKLAMLQVDERLRADGASARLLLQVHDELVLEAPAAEAEGVGKLTATIMEQVTALKVPLVVDVGVGPSWG